MKKINYLLISIFLASCTSNTIFEKPENLIPKDTMSLLIQELMIASSAKYVKNKNLQKDVNYMPFVFDRFKIDSTRFQTSNMYYMSKIDLYQEILRDAKTQLEKQKEILNKIQTKKDSIRADSLLKTREKKKLKVVDSLGNKKIKDTLNKLTKLKESL